MHHPSRFSSVCQHRHWLSVHLLALTVTSLLMACGPAASTRATHPATIVLYASNANHYASFDSPNFRDTVTALRTSDGSLLWRFQPAGVVSTTDKYALTMVDDIVYITTNRGGSTITGTVYALHAADGSLLWHYELKDETQLVSIADGIVYLTTQTLAGPDNAGELSALRASDGTLL